MIAVLLLNIVAAIWIFVLYKRYQSSQRNVAELTQLISQSNQALLDLMAENIRLRRRPMILNSRLYHAYRIDPATIHRN
jgi:cell division protein FtsL